VQQPDPQPLPTLTSEAYRITVDDGRESFFALSLEEPDNDAGWIISDTVCSLDALR
jgi:hypothetical protein